MSTGDQGTSKQPVDRAHDPNASRSVHAPARYDELWRPMSRGSESLTRCALSLPESTHSAPLRYLDPDLQDSSGWQRDLINGLPSIAELKVRRDLDDGRGL